MGDAVSTHGLITLMPAGGARCALFFDVNHLATGADVAIAAGDTATGESSKSEKTHETHRNTRDDVLQSAYLTFRFATPDQPVEIGRLFGGREYGR